MVSMQLFGQSPQLRIVVDTCKELRPSLSSKVLFPFVTLLPFQLQEGPYHKHPSKPDTSGRITSTPINFSKARKRIHYRMYRLEQQYDHPIL